MSRDGRPAHAPVATGSAAAVPTKTQGDRGGGEPIQHISYGQRLRDLAAERPAETAVVFAAEAGWEREIEWAELERRANQMARCLAAAGVEPGDLVVVGLRNTPEHLFSTFGAWKLGASVLPLRPELPPWERDRLLAVASARAVIGDWEDDGSDASLSLSDVENSQALDGGALEEDHVPPHARVIATSGSTGTPKLIVSPSPGLYPGEFAPIGTEVSRTVAMTSSPLYHTNGSAYCYPPLLNGNKVVLMERFEAARAVDLIERYRVNATVLVPTMLQRIAKLDNVHDRDFSSLEQIIYGGASIAEWVVREWLTLVAPEVFRFTYGGSEGIGLCMCTGLEWLEHPGTTGRPLDCQILILDDEHEPVGAGVIGEIWMKRYSETEPFRYVGVETPEPILGGYRSFGDMGWLDEDGYLYIADRRQDMIVSGGANIFPAEVEAALSEHPEVADVVAIGLADPEWGRRVHAIVQPADPDRPPSEESLRTHCKARLSGPKVPKSFEMVASLPRTAAGKINRSRLTDERAKA